MLPILFRRRSRRVWRGSSRTVTARALFLLIAGMSCAPLLAVGQAESAIAQAREQLKLGQLDKALELLHQFPADDTEPKGVEYLRGLVLYQQGSFEQAA